MHHPGLANGLESRFSAAWAEIKQRIAAESRKDRRKLGGESTRDAFQAQAPRSMCCLLIGARVCRLFAHPWKHFPLIYSETIRTEFLPPNGFSTVSLAFGSGSHWPSTTNRYSCRPGFMLRSPTQRPLPRSVSGVVSGFHPLKDPATNTCLAPGLTNSNEIRLIGRGGLEATGSILGGSVLMGFGLGATNFIGSAFCGSAFCDSILIGFTAEFFGFFVVLIIIGLTTNE